MAQKNDRRIETARTNCPEKKRLQNVLNYLERKLAEEQRKNPATTGLTYKRGCIEYKRAAKTAQPVQNKQQQALETLREFFTR
jgi:hypothetical protein